MSDGIDTGNPNTVLWDAVKQVPPQYLKRIGGGRLVGLSDINPMWRLYAATEHFGQCGTGWFFTIDKLWTEPGAEGEVLAFAAVSLFTGPDAKAIPGIGGSKLIAMESKGLRSNDECFKMAVTDAQGVALKALGFGAEVYAGKWDGSKYLTDDETLPIPPQPAAQGIPAAAPAAPPPPSQADHPPAQGAAPPPAAATAPAGGTPDKPAQSKDFFDNMPTCSQCGQSGYTVRPDKEKQGQFYCWKKIGGCGNVNF